MIGIHRWVDGLTVQSSECLLPPWCSDSYEITRLCTGSAANPISIYFPRPVIVPLCSFSGFKNISTLQSPLRAAHDILMCSVGSCIFGACIASEAQETCQYIHSEPIVHKPNIFGPRLISCIWIHWELLIRAVLDAQNVLSSYVRQFSVPHGTCSFRRFDG